MSDCRAQTIPLHGVSMDTVRNDLKTFQRKIAVDGNKLHIPPSRVSEYYKLKVADCSVTRNRIIWLRMPIKRPAHD